jgi:hypothetical protein
MPDDLDRSWILFLWVQRGKIGFVQTPFCHFGRRILFHSKLLKNRQFSPLASALDCGELLVGRSILRGAGNRYKAWCLKLSDIYWGSCEIAFVRKMWERSGSGTAPIARALSRTYRSAERRNGGTRKVFTLAVSITGTSAACKKMFNFGEHPRGIKVAGFP